MVATTFNQRAVENLPIRAEAGVAGAGAARGLLESVLLVEGDRVAPTRGRCGLEARLRPDRGSSLRRLDPREATLEAMAADLARPVGDLPVLSADERAKDLERGVRLGRYLRCRGSSVLGRDEVVELQIVAQVEPTRRAHCDAFEVDHRFNRDSFCVGTCGQ